MQAVSSWHTLAQTEGGAAATLHTPQEVSAQNITHSPTRTHIRNPAI